MNETNVDLTESEAARACAMTEVKDFHDLRVWQGAMNLAEQVYRITGRFPKTEMYGLTTQLRRAAISVPSNIAEGHARESRKEYLHFLSVAQSPLSELSTQLELPKRLQYISCNEFQEVISNATSLRKQLFALRSALQR